MSVGRLCCEGRQRCDNLHFSDRDDEKLIILVIMVPPKKIEKKKLTDHIFVKFDLALRVAVLTM